MRTFESIKALHNGETYKPGDVLRLKSESSEESFLKGSIFPDSQILCIYSEAEHGSVTLVLARARIARTESFSKNPHGVTPLLTYERYEVSENMLTHYHHYIVR